jgi:hypothetical protein
MFRLPAIFVMMNTARVINFYSIKIFPVQNRRSSHDDYMSGIFRLLNRSLELPSDNVPSPRLAELRYGFPPTQRLLSQPIQELKVHSSSRTCVPGFNGYPRSTDTALIESSVQQVFRRQQPQ